MRPLGRALIPLLAALGLLMGGCGAAETAEAPVSAEAGAPAGEMALDYARGFSVEFYTDGTSLVTIADADRFLLVPRGTEPPADPGAGVTVLYTPLERIYLASSSSMDYFRELEALDRVRLTSTKAADWSLPAVRQALEAGDMLYAGKYAAPDYELLLSQDTELAVESTMIFHSPETREQLEALGIPVLVERSSYEPEPLGRMEWIKLYGLLTGRLAEAEAFFAEQTARVSALEAADTGRTAAFFYLSPNGYAVVRKPGDYISRMIAMAGGTYILPPETDTEENALSTMQMEMESFYEAARDADVLFYNSTIDGRIDTVDELLRKSALLSDFKAVREGNVWCTEQNVFQQTTGIGGMIVDMNRILAGEAGDGSDLTFFHHVDGS